MKLNLISALVLCFAPAMFAADGHKALRGTVETIDVAGEVMELKTPDGVVYQITVTEAAEVDGVKARRPVLGAIKKGSVVVAHGVAKGSTVAAVGVYRVGKGGLEVSQVTVKAVGDGGKFLVVTTAKGAEEIYHISSTAVATAAKGTAKGTKVAVYSTTRAGRKVAHFFESL